jgi:hypothetical protein
MIGSSSKLKRTIGKTAELGQRPFRAADDMNRIIAYYSQYEKA